MSDQDQKVEALEASLSDEDRVFLDQLADGIVRRRLAAAAMFFLESMKPLGFLGSQMMVFLRPLVQVVWHNPATYDRVTRLLERRGSLELLLRRLEARS